MMGEKMKIEFHDEVIEKAPEDLQFALSQCSYDIWDYFYGGDGIPAYFAYEDPYELEVKDPYEITESNFDRVFNLVAKHYAYRLDKDESELKKWLAKVVRLVS